MITLLARVECTWGLCHNAIEFENVDSENMAISKAQKNGWLVHVFDLEDEEGNLLENGSRMVCMCPQCVKKCGNIEEAKKAIEEDAKP